MPAKETPRKQKLLALEAQLIAMQESKRLNKLKDYISYPKQRDFHALGKTKRERLLMAGNQLGKTYCGAMETAMHATGIYPDDWAGRKWDRPTIGWAGGVSSLVVRDVQQALLLGSPWPHGKGTGAIPLECIVDISMARGIQDAVDTVFVKHISGGLSTIQFKSYEQGRTKWQGASLDYVWFDEEPPYDIYSEGVTRTNATKGMAFLTFTPLFGMSDVVCRFVDEEHKDHPDRGYVQMTIDDAKHIDEDQKQAIIASYADWEVEARINGVPMLGSGRIFAIPEERIVVEPFEIPMYWPQIVGLDIGMDHPTGACLLAWDRDTDTIYVTQEHRMSDEIIAVNAAAIKPWGKDLPVAWPHDAAERDKGSGEAVSTQYGSYGLKMCPHNATFSKEDGGGVSVEAGVLDMNERMKTGRLKVFKTCQLWLGEFRMYHRKDGLIVKVKDDLLCASRYGIMMKRYARSLNQLGDVRAKRAKRNTEAAKAQRQGTNQFNPFEY